MSKIPDPELSDPCYGLVQRVYKNGDLKVSLYPHAVHLSLFLFKPGQSIPHRVERQHVYKHQTSESATPAFEKGQLVRFDTFLGQPRYIVCDGRFKPGQLRGWQAQLKRGIRPEILSRYSELVDRTFLDTISDSAQEELRGLENIIDAFSSAPVREFLDEFEKMLVHYLETPKSSF